MSIIALFITLPPAPRAPDSWSCYCLLQQPFSARPNKEWRNDNKIGEILVLCKYVCVGTYRRVLLFIVFIAFYHVGGCHVNFRLLFIRFAFPPSRSCRKDRRACWIFKQIHVWRIYRLRNVVPGAVSGLSASRFFFEVFLFFFAFFCLSLSLCSFYVFKQGFKISPPRMRVEWHRRIFFSTLSWRSILASFIASSVGFPVTQHISLVFCSWTEVLCQSWKEKSVDSNTTRPTWVIHREHKHAGPQKTAENDQRTRINCVVHCCCLGSLEFRIKKQQQKKPQVVT